MTDKGAQARIDGTQAAVAVLAWVVGGWKLLGYVVAVMLLAAFASRLIVIYIDHRTGADRLDNSGLSE